MGLFAIAAIGAGVVFVLKALKGSPANGFGIPDDQLPAQAKAQILVPSAPLRTNKWVQNGRTYAIQEFAGNLVLITGQAVQVLERFTGPGVSQVVETRGTSAAVARAIADTKPFFH